MNIKEKLAAMLRFRRFWTAVGGMVLGVVNDGFGLNVSPETINNILLLAGAWTLGR